MRPADRGSAAGDALGAVLVVAVVVAVVIAIAAAGLLPVQPRVVVGDPLPVEWGLGYGAKPVPPKAIDVTVGPDVGVLDKPVALDLGGAPAPVSVAQADDPLVRSLGVRLQQALAASGDAGQVGLFVVDADGRAVFDLGGATPLIPASTAKLVTAAAALTAYGPEHTFSTQLLATASPDGAGVVPGDLVLVGGGDPTLVSPSFVAQRIAPDRPATPIDGLAAQVQAAGITRIDGAVVGDAGFLAGDALADGWPARYLEALDATPISALTVDRGLSLVTERGRTVAEAATDPAAEAAAALTAALIARGIVVGGAPRSAQGPVPGADVPLGSLRSPPLSTILARVVQRSDNHMADTLFRVLGRRVEGVGSFADGARMSTRVLDDLQLDWRTTTLSDGSGLSRTTAVSPAVLTILNYRMTNSAVGPLWQDLMAVSGQSGTLSSRLTGSIAELRLRGKTGSLRDVRALSGAVVGPDGRPLYFTVVSNGLADGQQANARRLQDLVVLALAAELYGCTEIPQPDLPPTPPGDLPPLPVHTCA
jgi:serine-type D-Ala-D-Ala carboxypeptidase/endopeptidase (penicillin-binding protein 4)